jgi:hypothetical protein
MIEVPFIAVKFSELGTFAFDDRGLRVLPQPRVIWHAKYACHTPLSLQ